MRIGEVAEIAGVSVQTLRYYERRGILDPPDRTISGYRNYPSGTVDRIRFIKRAQALGFSLTEIAEIVSLRVGGKNRRKVVLARIEAKLRSIDLRMDALRRIREALERLAEACRSREDIDDGAILDVFDMPDLGDGPVPES